MVALTFDGPDPHRDAPYLNFAQTVQRARNLFCPGKPRGQLRRCITAGIHRRARNWKPLHNHASLSKLDAQGIAFQVQETDERISHLLPTAPVLSRPPYGAINDAAREAIQKPFVLWSIDTQDWKNRSSGAIASEVLEKVKDGDIILMHDLYAATADACEVNPPRVGSGGLPICHSIRAIGETGHRSNGRAGLYPRHSVIWKEIVNFLWDG